MTTRGRARDRGARSLLWPEVVDHPSRFSRIAPLQLRSTPMLLLAVCFAGGILCRRWWQPPVQMILVCTSLMCVACVARVRTPRLAWLSTGMLWIALGWTAAVLQPNVLDTSLLRYTDGLQRTMEARVMSVRHLPPSLAPSGRSRADHEEKADEGRGATRQATEVLEVQVLAMEDVSPDTSRMTPVRGGAVLTLMQTAGHDEANVLCGSRVRMKVRLHTPQRYLDPGVWSYANALRARGIVAESSVDGVTLHTVERTHVPLSCRFAEAQRWSSMRLLALAQSSAFRRLPDFLRLTQTDAAMLSAMLFGDRTLL